MANELVKSETMAISQRGGIAIQNLADLREIATLALKAGITPPGLNTIEKVMVAIGYGLEVGLSPFQSVQTVCVVNNKPSMYGDGPLAVVRRSGLLERFKETYVPATAKVKGKDGKEYPNESYVCITKRRGDPEEVKTQFSVADAIRADLINKPGAWKTNRKRMLQLRARGFNLRDGYPDVLHGLIAAEEAEDYPPEAKTAPPVKELPSLEAALGKMKSPEIPPAPEPIIDAEILTGDDLPTDNVPQDEIPPDDFSQSPTGDVAEPEPQAPIASGRDKAIVKCQEYLETLAQRGAPEKLPKRLEDMATAEIWNLQAKLEKKVRSLT